MTVSARLAESISIPVVISGGMHTREDLEKAVGLEEMGVKGVILGKSLYEGTIDLADAVQSFQGEGDGL